MEQSGAALAPEDLLHFFKKLDCRGTLYVALSGGMDSTALVLLLAQLREQLHASLAAIHVNHGAHPDAAHWAEHCQRLCDALDIPLTQVPPPADPLPKDSPEAQWRAWRLQAFEAVLGKQDVVCTAHHRQDQAEGLLLALLRSSGPEGLAAMPAIRTLGKGRLARPFLQLPRDTLQRYLTQHDVAFIEDPGNHDTGLDRNYLRHELMPVLEKRWPAAEQSLATSAGLFATLSAMLADEGALALAGREPFPGVLDMGALTGEPEALALVIRLWLRRHDAPPLPRARLNDLVHQLTIAGPDSSIHFEWAQKHLYHGQNRLWLSDHAPTACTSSNDWDHGTINCGRDSGRLTVDPAEFDTSLRVAPRQGGERFRCAPDRPRRRLKQWLNDYRLPPWYRDSVPLLFKENQLVAVGDVILDRQLDSELAQKNGTLQWKPANPQLEWAWQECRRLRLQVE